MIKCIAIDDEPLALKQIASYISKVPYLELVASCKSADEAEKVLKTNSIDAMFVDINMPDMNGLDFVKSLGQAPIVVFTTAYSEYAVDGYKVNAVDYLMKPFGPEELKEAADKVKKQFDLRSAAISNIDDDCVFIKTEHKIVRVNIGDITYVEAMSEYLRIHIENQQKSIVVLLSMKKMEERLPASRFMRIHRSHIINLKKIKEATKSFVTLNDGVELPIGDLYKENFMSYINSKFMSK